MVGHTIQQAFDLAIQHHRAGRLSDAEQLYRQILARQPRHAEAMHLLGVVAMQCFQNDTAAKLIREALAINPNLAAAHHNLGGALAEQGYIDEAIDAYRRAIALDPGNAGFGSGLLYTLLFHPGYNERSIAEELARWNQRHGVPLRPATIVRVNDPDPCRCLRVGYVSAEFRMHVIGRSLLPILLNRDRENFHVTCYSDVTRVDSMTARFQQTADAWRDIAGMSDAQAARQIEEDQIDILVDLTVHLADNRLLVFARKPAALQVTYLGYCGSTGLDTVDYRLSDPHLDPPESDLSGYSEKTVRLPRTYWCYQPIDAPDVAPLPALKSGRVTFGCMNVFAKVSQPALDLWARILRGTPGSRLMIHSPPGAHLERVAARMLSAGVTADRVAFVATQPWDKYLETYGEIDICLDPFPYAGGITTCDALWMGAPVVSLSGQTAVGRGGRGILTNIGLAELVAYSPDEYARLAIELAQDLPRLQALRADMRRRMLQSPLMDAPALARDIEAAYRQMWRDRCEGRV